MHQRGRLFEERRDYESAAGLVKLIKSYAQLKSKFFTGKTMEDLVSQRLLGLIEKEMKFLQGMENFNNEQFQSMCNVKTTMELEEKYRRIKTQRININVSEETVGGGYLMIASGGVKPEERLEEKSRDCLENDDDKTERQPNYLETRRKRQF